MEEQAGKVKGLSMARGQHSSGISEEIRFLPRPGNEGKRISELLIGNREGQGEERSHVRVK